jgi:hypothetical protein
MNVQPATILAMVDCIVESTTADDVRIAVEGIRNLKLNGTKPSFLLQRCVIAAETGQPSDDVSSETSSDLQGRIVELTHQVSELEAENAHLETQVANLNQQVSKFAHGNEPVNGFYTMEQFMAILTAKLRRSYGWRTDYILASVATPDCTPVATETIHKWQTTDKVPEWAVTQISRMAFKKRPGAGGKTWSDDEEQYLVDQYQFDPSQKNVVLAQLCETQFGRSINENSIKGALDRLRKKGSLPSKRPKRTDSACSI